MATVLSIIGLLLVIAGIRYVIQHRQLSSGREIGCYHPCRTDGNHVFEFQAGIRTGETWCRLLISFKAESFYHIDHSPKNLFKHTAMTIGTPYDLTISDESGSILYNEQDSLARFIAWTGSKSGGTQTLFSDRETSVHNGKRITFLEFMPRKAGLYRFHLSIRSRSDDQSQRSRSSWEITEAELTLMEDVIPLSKTVRYPHNRVLI